MRCPNGSRRDKNGNCVKSENKNKTKRCPRVKINREFV